MQRAIIRSRLLFISIFLTACGIATQHIALRHEAGEERAVCAEQQDGVEGGEEGGEDACDDGLPCYADVGAEGCEE